MKKTTSNHTFVICAYGDSPYLEECVKSVLSQTISSEVILYTSTASSYIRSICNSYQIPLHIGVGGSIGADWNNALSFVKTQYATIAHQDDYYEPTYAEKILDKVSSDTLIAFSDYYELKNNKKVLTSINLKIKRFMLAVMMIFPRYKWWRRRVLSFGNPISCPAVTYNLYKLNGFQFNSKLKVSIDWYAWAEISNYKGKFTYVPEKLMFHRIHEESETSNMIKDNTRTSEDLLMYEQFWPKPIAYWINKYYKKSQQSNSD